MGNINTKKRGPKIIYVFFASQGMCLAIFKMVFQNNNSFPITQETL